MGDEYVYINEKLSNLYIANLLNALTLVKCYHRFIIIASENEDSLLYFWEAKSCTVCAFCSV